MLKSHSPSAGRRHPQTPSEIFWYAHWPSWSRYLCHHEPPPTSPWKLLDAPFGDGVVNWFVSDGQSVCARVLDSKGATLYGSSNGGVARRFPQDESCPGTGEIARSSASAPR